MSVTNAIKAVKAVAGAFMVVRSAIMFQQMLESARHFAEVDWWAAAFFMVAYGAGVWLANSAIYDFLGWIFAKETKT